MRGASCGDCAADGDNAHDCASGAAKAEEKALVCRKAAPASPASAEEEEAADAAAVAAVAAAQGPCAAAYGRWRRARRR